MAGGGQRWRVSGRGFGVARGVTLALVPLSLAVGAWALPRAAGAPAALAVPDAVASGMAAAVSEARGTLAAEVAVASPVSEASAAGETGSAGMAAVDGDLTARSEGAMLEYLKTGAVERSPAAAVAGAPAAIPAGTVAGGTVSGGGIVVPNTQNTQSAQNSPGSQNAPATTGAQSAQNAPSAQVSPSQAVLGFYQAVVQHQFDRAAQHWTPRMRANYPPPVYIVDRFSRTRQMTVRRIDVLSLNETTGRATLAVELAEVSSFPAFNRSWAGTWQLVRTSGGWLLDQPNFGAG